MEFSSLYKSNIKIFQHSNKKSIVRLQNNNLGEFKKDDKPGFVHHELDKCHAMIWHRRCFFDVLRTYLVMLY